MEVFKNKKFLCEKYLKRKNLSIGLSFSTFETLKLFVLTERIPLLSFKTHLIADEHHKYELTVVGKLICGGLTGAIAQTFTYPLDVVRRHMQLEGMIEDKEFKR